VRTALAHFLARDVEEFKARLQAKGDVEIEHLKSSLDLKSSLEMTAYEHQVRFSNLHAKRAEIIAEIYSRMVDAEQHGPRFAYSDVFKEDHQQAFLTTWNKLLDFYFFLQKHRIYLSQSVCLLMEGFEALIRTTVVRAHIYEPIKTPASAKILEEKIRVIQEVSDAFDKKVPEARSALESEFRRLLGVEGEGKLNSPTSRAGDQPLTRTKTPSSLTP
jgi:hypothetical protein